MTLCLRLLALVVALGGLLAAGALGSALVGDEAYERAVLVSGRNPGNVLFESELRLHEARRVFLATGALAGLVLALVGGALLGGLGSLHAKVDRLLGRRGADGGA